MTPASSKPVVFLAFHSLLSCYLIGPKVIEVKRVALEHFPNFFTHKPRLQVEGGFESIQLGSACAQ